MAFNSFQLWGSIREETDKTWKFNGILGLAKIKRIIYTSLKIKSTPVWQDQTKTTNILLQECHSDKLCDLWELWLKWPSKCWCSYPMPAPSSNTSFPLMHGSIPITSGCSSCVKVSALLSNIISSTLCAIECLFQNSVIWSRVWFDSTRAATENRQVLH